MKWMKYAYGKLASAIFSIGIGVCFYGLLTNIEFKGEIMIIQGLGTFLYLIVGAVFLAAVLSVMTWLTIWAIWLEPNCEDS